MKKQLVVHPNVAMAGALAFCAAAKQGKAKEMDESIWEKGYKKNRDLDESTTKDGTNCWDTPDGCPKVVSYAQDLGLDLNQFKADMKGDCQDLVKKDMANLRQFGIGGTPALIINGRFIPGGAVPITSITPVIDEELKKANERIQQGTPAAEYYQQWVMDKGLKSLKDG